MSPNASDILAGRYPSFHEPLRYARRWNRGGDDDELKEANTLLEELKARYPTALCVWYESALNLVKRKQPEKALDLLKQIDRQFAGRLDEDIYALWGRCYKDAGHKYMDKALTPGAKPLERTAALEDADREYENALAQYVKGHALSQNWFPAINIAFLKFKRAALAHQLGRPSDELTFRTESHKFATELTVQKPWLKNLPDDDIWHAATRGEAYALLGKWEEAASFYRRAESGNNVLKHHRDTMGAQLRRIVQGYELLSEQVPAEISELARSLNPDGVA